MTLLEQLSLENGWTPDVNHGNVIAHHFNGDAITPQRTILIAHAPGHEFATFSCSCRAKFAASGMSPVVLAAFLARDETPFANWRISIENGIVSAKASYTALVGGLDAKMFKVICVSLLEEVAFIEAGLHSKGLL